MARLMKLLTRRGALVDGQRQTHMANDETDGEEARTLRLLRAAAITDSFVFGPRARHKLPTLRDAMAGEARSRQPLCADIDGSACAPPCDAPLMTARDWRGGAQRQDAPELVLANDRFRRVNSISWKPAWGRKHAQTVPF